MTEWHDISTAPKDGTRFDCWAQSPSAGWRLTDVKWDHENAEWVHGTVNFMWSIEAPVSVATGEPVVKVTHWMPLPAPPHPSQVRENV